MVLCLFYQLWNLCFGLSTGRMQKIARRSLMPRRRQWRRLLSLLSSANANWRKKRWNFLSFLYFLLIFLVSSFALQVLVLYDEFFQQNENGEISKEKFLEERQVLQPPPMRISIVHNWQDNFLAESLFDVFDEDKSGALNFYEFMLVKVTSGQARLC